MTSRIVERTGPSDFRLVQGARYRVIETRADGRFRLAGDEGWPIWFHPSRFRDTRPLGEE